MIQHPSFPAEPWSVRETELDLDTLAQAESVFALSNGHIGVRATLDEGEPAGMPGTYLNGVYDLRPLPYAEAGYGNPEADQMMVNVTNGKIIRLLVDDEPLDVRYGDLLRHERILDMRGGLLHRSAEWVSPTGKTVRVSSTRMVSLSQRAVVAIRYEVEALDEPLQVVVQSELVPNETMPSGVTDPRSAALVASPLELRYHVGEDLAAVFVHETSNSALLVGAAMTHEVTGPPGTETMLETFEDIARVTAVADLRPGGPPLCMLKFLGYGWSGTRSIAALRDQVRAALVGARHTGWEGLVREQRLYLDDFWRRADVEIEGDEELQQAVRFALFHILQAGARAEHRAIPAKGLTGSGYNGHAFWDTEMFVLPVLTYTTPPAARDALLWRRATIEPARERANQLGLRGASFPWRTIRGEECSGYWPAGTAAFHVNADVADAVVRYVDATGDEDFERRAGLELLVETARLWLCLGHYDKDGRFRIDGITGPDEYSAIADNNVYTNLMARRNLRAAASAAGRHPAAATELGAEESEISEWLDAAGAMFIPFDERLGVHPQAEGFTDHDVWPFESTSTDQYPLLLHFPYFDLYRKQVVKQADLVLAMHLCGEEFTDEQKARNFAYYEALTVRDSSLSACTQAVLAAETGHLQLAYDYLVEAALIDLYDLQHNTRDGLHIASLAGTWIGAVCGLGGMRDHGGALGFAPRLPDGITRLAFRLAYRGRGILVELEDNQVTYTLLEGGALELLHDGASFSLEPGQAVTRPLVPVQESKAPVQPAGRAPQPRLSRKS